MCFNPLNAELNAICHLLALLGGATIVVVSRLRVNNSTFLTLCALVGIIKCLLSLMHDCNYVEVISYSCRNSNHDFSDVQTIA
jgi:hypothetical protein